MYCIVLTLLIFDTEINQSINSRTTLNLKIGPQPRFSAVGYIECEICRKIFKLSSIVRHPAVHDGNRHKCDLKRHKGDKPYSCL